MGGFAGVLDPLDAFGSAISQVGDIDGDGTVDLAVGSPFDGEGAIWLLFQTSAGLIQNEAKISSSSGGFMGSLGTGD